MNSVQRHDPPLGKWLGRFVGSPGSARRPNVLAFYRGAEGDVGRNALFGMKPRGSDPPGARLGTQARLHAAWEISTIGSLPTVTANSLA